MRRAFPVLAVLLWLAGVRMGEAALQFDVFPGYEGAIHEAGWFPVTCEVFNDGPSFNAVIEISSGGALGSDQRRTVPVELPTNTRKRIVVPMFASGGRFNPQWDARLLTEAGKELQKRENLPVKIVAWEGLILAALPRNFGGAPVFPELKQNRQETRIEVARIPVEQFPDNPISLEGLNTVYLNSEKAIDLKAPQVSALIAWVRGGGHLIVAVETPGDVNSTPWLKQFLPIEVSGTANAAAGEAVTTWLKSEVAAVPVEDMQINRAGGRRARATGSNAYANLALGEALSDGDTQVAVGTLKDGTTLISGKSGPLAVQGPRGRGKVTVLTFSPEREPFRSWKSRGYFWAKLAGIPGELFNSGDFASYGGTSVDGVLGALIDSRQVKKLPVTWLLLLLVVYLVVIGPFDQWWLKKINRQMWTWVTFPSYVVLFSLLIYFIGYKLRAGETEWNELNIVDVLPRGDKVDLRGRTYISIYSSSNARYPIEGQEGHATFRTELTDLYSGGREARQARVIQYGNSFKAEVDVPVWTSLLFANDWFRTNDIPFVATVNETGSDYQVDVQNLLDVPLSEMRLVVNQMVFEVEAIPAREKKTLRLAPAKGTPLRQWVQQNAGHFQRAVELRRNPLGDTSGGHLEDRALTGAAVSLLASLDEPANAGRGFIGPNGLELSALAERGDAILFAFLPNFSFNEKLNRFEPPRFRRDTLLRLTVPVRPSNS